MDKIVMQRLQQLERDWASAAIDFPDASKQKEYRLFIKEEITSLVFGEKAKYTDVPDLEMFFWLKKERNISWAYNEMYKQPEKVVKPKPFKIDLGIKEEWEII